ncbi:RidA family protein [Entomobacter blattae]|uniref:YjgF/chorismate_mutase-like, putative endoribonuclease n=1 Tax=Entomobacter blattae TaxID=2762277 RepID=A0A7H1NQ67_9PROT|nr:RidA family protein [Entomobacter blattae]QNT77927.1 YjgF/chorismate_mutase-like, putative endoribonuclease [Entomobacter blattae]
MIPQNAKTKLKELGITLPEAAKPVANYVPAIIAGSQLIISGQLPFRDGKLVATGLLGQTVSLEQGTEAARWCMVNIIAQAQAALDGSLGRIKRLIRLGGFVASTPDFTNQPQVINGASDLAVAVFEDAGKHARSAVGVASLPLNAAVEIEALFEIAT